MLNLDITLLSDPKRFQEMCFRLARYEFRDAIPVSESWDGGRDVVIFDSSGAGDVVFQCKFTKNLIGAKAKIAASLDTMLRSSRRTARWVLCVPVNPSAKFLDWLQRELNQRCLNGHLWARNELLARLEQHPDVVDTFFYSVFSELASHFRTERLELYKLRLDSACEWKQSDEKVLYFGPSNLVKSPDLLLDVIVRNRGTVDTLITTIEAEVFDRRQKMHGLPGDGLLFPQITYSISIHNGQVGTHSIECEPPLVVKAGSLERCKIRITDTGFAWNGGLRLALVTGNADRLYLPAMRIFT